MRKFTNMLVALLAVFAVTTAARADVIASPVIHVIDHFWVVVLVIVVVIVAAALLRIFRKK